MSIYDKLENFQDEIIKCMKCGNCQAVCPIYQETLGEASVARGKIKLADAILKGQVESTEALGERFNLCLTCKACKVNCPCGVQVDKIILAARAHMVQKKGLHPVKKAIFTGLKSHGLFDWGLKLGGKFQGLMMNINKEKQVINPRFNFGLDPKRIFPAIASRTLKDSVPENNKVANPKMRVGYFTGCMINHMYTDMGKSVISVLKKNGIEVVVPKKQHCCGVPTFVHGDLEKAKELARSLVDMFYDYKLDAIITSCSSCSGSWKQNFVDLLKDEPKYYQKAKELSEISYDISEFLMDKIDMNLNLGEVKAVVTYHDPCHLNRGQGIKNQPREVLRKIPGIEFREMSAPDRCCGGAGSFSLTHYPLSKSILEKKIDDVQKTKADYVVTSCPSCTMQLMNGTHLFGDRQPSYHVVQLLDRAYKNKNC